MNHSVTQALVALSLAACCFTAAPAALHAQQETQPPAAADPKQQEDIDALLDFLDDWDGDAERLMKFLRRTFDTPEELQAIYELLPDDVKVQVDKYVEHWSFEGGIGIYGGFATPFGDGDGQGLFRLSLSGGIVWPVGDFDVPIYYVFTDIPSPSAWGFQVHAHTDNFDALTGAVTAHWGGSYFGWSPYVDIGPTAKFDFGGDLAAGARFDVGYGNILIQGFAQTEFFFDDASTFTAVFGVRIPWLLFTLF